MDHFCFLCFSYTHSRYSATTLTKPLELRSLILNQVSFVKWKFAAYLCRHYIYCYAQIYSEFLEENVFRQHYGPDVGFTKTSRPCWGASICCQSRVLLCLSDNEHNGAMSPCETGDKAHTKKLPVYINIYILYIYILYINTNILIHNSNLNLFGMTLKTITNLILRHNKYIKTTLFPHRTFSVYIKNLIQNVSFTLQYKVISAQNLQDGD
jgi:hypothetical protein